MSSVDFSLPTEGVNTSVVRKQSPISNEELPTTNEKNSQSLISDQSTAIVEATGWLINEQGQVILVATETNPGALGDKSSSPNCHQL